MRSVPTTSLDLTAPEVVADPYPYFAAERARHAVAWHEPSGTYLTFSARDRARRCSATAASAGSGRTRSRSTTSSRSTCCTATR